MQRRVSIRTELNLMYGQRRYYARARVRRAGEVVEISGAIGRTRLDAVRSLVRRLRQTRPGYKEVVSMLPQVMGQQLVLV